MSAGPLSSCKTTTSIPRTRRQNPRCDSVSDGPIRAVYMDHLARSFSRMRKRTNLAGAATPRLFHSTFGNPEKALMGRKGILYGCFSNVQLSGFCCGCHNSRRPADPDSSRRGVLGLECHNATDRPEVRVER